MTAGNGGERRSWDTLGGPDPFASRAPRQRRYPLRYLRLWYAWEHCRRIRWSLAVAIATCLLVISGFWLAGKHLPCRVTTTVSDGRVSSVVSVCALPDVTDYVPWVAAIALLLVPWWRIPWERITRLGWLGFGGTANVVETAASKVLSEAGSPDSSVSGQELAQG